MYASARSKDVGVPSLTAERAGAGPCGTVGGWDIAVATLTLTDEGELMHCLYT